MGLGTRRHLGAGTSGLMNRSISKCQLRGLRRVTDPCAVCDMMQAQSTPAVPGGFRNKDRQTYRTAPLALAGCDHTGGGRDTIANPGSNNPTLRRDGNIKTSRRPWRPPLLPSAPETKKVSPRTKQGSDGTRLSSAASFKVAVPKSMDAFSATHAVCIW